MYEKYFKPNQLIAVNTDAGVEDITLHQLMKNLKLLSIEVEDTLVVEWWYDGDHIEVSTIYNDDTGKVYWEKNDLPENRMWSDADETLVDNLLMWGELDNND